MDSVLNDIRRVFEEMKVQGWAPSQRLKWGFFFHHAQIEPLWLLKDELTGQGYQFESLHRADAGTFVLQVSKVAIRSPEQIHEQNLAFNELAETRGIMFYDGWDVGMAEA